MKVLRIALLLLFPLLMSSFESSAVALSQEQMNRLKNMSASERQRLAAQLGVDLSALEAAQNGGKAQAAQAITPSTAPYPRGTQFDALGNPMMPDASQTASETASKKPLRLYGLDLFAGEPTSYTPITNVPVPSNYVLGAGDSLLLQLYGKENSEYELTVDRDGKVVIPRLGPALVAGKTLAEAKSFLTELVKRQIIGVEVSVSMGELRTMRVFVMGEAYKPGAYNVSSLSTITNALFVSGGFSEIASLRNIQLKRGGQLIETLDLYDLLNAGDSSKDVLLQPGDVVFIPPLKSTVKVDGLVRRPAIYELKHNESLSDVLKMAGGKLPEGYAQAIGVKRFENGLQVQLTVDLTKQDIKVKNGDEIVVSKVAPQVANAVTLIGAVARPGKYQWSQEMRLSALLGDRQASLLEMADLSYVLILRDQQQSGELEVLQADLTALVSDDDATDPVLAPNDRILVFSKIESELLGDIHLDDLAYTKEELEEQERQRWEERIEEKLFYQQIGLGPQREQGAFDEDLAQLTNKTLIELTNDERERVLEFKDSTFYSRKRMLTPVVAKLRDQAKLGAPLQLVEIVGEVKVPGIYPLAKGATIRELIKAAGGLTESSYGQKSEITRTLINDQGEAEVTHIHFQPDGVLTGNAEDLIALQSKDRVNIFTIPSWQEDLTVKVVGEVEFPGEYTIRRGETLRDLLQRVGGLTSFGEPNAAIFTRESLKEQERKNLVRLAEELRKQIASESLRKQSGAGAIVSYSEARNLLRDLTKVQPVGRLVIDLQSIIDGDSEVSIVLEDGDALYIPGKSQSVNVIGEVYVPSSHLYQRDLGYEDYILRSGGFKELADERKTYIIRADGSVTVPGSNDGFWFASNDNAQVRPGDTIVVPFDSAYVDNTTLWTNATQIIYQLAVAVAAIGSL